MKSIFQKLLSLKNAYDIEKLINGDEFRLTFNKTYFDQTQNKVLVGDPVSIDNNLNFLNMYISQEFIHLRKYFENIEARKTEYNGTSVVYSETPEEYATRMIDVKKTKIIILKIFNQIAYYKGTIEYILFFVRFFVKLKGYDLYDKTEVNVFDSYYYSVTANCSLEEWEEIIKPIVHPVGFNCFFINVNGRDFSNLIQTKNFNIDMQKTKLDIGFQNSNLNYYDGLDFEELASIYKDNFTDGFLFDSNNSTIPLLHIDKDTKKIISLNDNVKYVAVSKSTITEKSDDIITIGSTVYNTPADFYTACTDLPTVDPLLEIDDTLKYVFIRMSIVDLESVYSPTLVFQKR